MMKLSMETKTSTLRVPLITSFVRYNASAYTATFFDYGMFLFCLEILNIYYPIATFIGATTGASVAFLLGRNWTFKNKEELITKQSLRFLAVVSGSILLNTLGVYLVTEYIGINEKISKIIVAVIVGVSYNFPMQRYFVFK